MTTPHKTIIAMLYLIAAAVSFSATLYVDNDAPTDPGPDNPAVSDPLEDGSLNHPFDAIQEAVTAAAPNDTIMLADGTYTGLGNRDIIINKPLTIRNPNGPNACILDFQGIAADRHFGIRIENVNTEAAAVSFSGICMQNAFATGSGGAIFAVNSTIQIKNSILQDNIAVYGGAVRATYSELEIEDCTIRRNAAQYGFGGAIHNYSSRVRLHNVQITQNTANSGGAIYADGGSELLAEKCTIANNSANSDGGGIYMGNGRIESSIIQANTAQDGRGGGIFAGNLSISNSLVCQNTAMNHGGGIYSVGMFNNNWLTISGCTIVNNRSTNWGGGIFADARIVNSIIHNNAAYGFGHQLAVRSLAVLSHCNLSNDENDIFLYDSQTDVISNKGMSNDPNFIDAGYWDTNGSPTDWTDDFFVGADYRLRPGSPCIDTADNDLIGLWTPQDLDGQVRMMDGDADDQAAMDMGCYEFAPPGVSVIQTDPQRIYFTYEPDDSSQQNQTVRIYNSGAGTVNWALSENCPWLQVDISSGSVDANGIDILLSVDAAGLDPNVYTCEISLTDPAAINTPFTTAVVLYVVPETGFWVPFHYPTIKQAADVAGNGDTILVADGHYWGQNSNTNVAISRSITVRSATGPQHCIISGSGNLQGSYGFRLEQAPSMVVDGFTLTGFNGSQNHAVLSLGGQSLITNCIFLDNTALGNNSYGVGLMSMSADTRVENCTFLGNTSDRGGAVRVRTTSDGLIHFSDCRFRQNIAADPSGGSYGGAIYLEDSRSEFDRCTFTVNHAGSGGAVFSQQGISMLVRRTDFCCNTAGGDGGAVSAGNADIEQCQFIANESLNGNGGGLDLYLSTGSAQVRDCLFDQNIANGTSYGEGGGVYFFGGYDGQLNISNTRFTGNQAYDGAGIFGWGGIVELDHIIIEGNSNEGLSYSYYDPWQFPDPTPSDPLIEGQGIWMNNCLVLSNRSVIFPIAGILMTGSCYIQNSIVWNNESPFSDIEESQIGMGGMLTMNHSVLMGGMNNIQFGGMSYPVLITDLGILDTDPLFVNPGHWDDNGTPDNWEDDIWIEGDYHLKSQGWRWDTAAEQWTSDDVTSPCIDAGNPGMALGDEPMPEDIDPENLRGQNIRINMGAYGGTPQASIAPPGWALLCDLDNSGRVDLADLAPIAAAWLHAGQALPPDVTRNGTVTLEDFAQLTAQWLDNANRPSP